MKNPVRRLARSLVLLVAVTALGCCLGCGDTAASTDEGGRVGASAGGAREKKAVNRSIEDDVNDLLEQPPESFTVERLSRLRADLNNVSNTRQKAAPNLLNEAFLSDAIALVEASLSALESQRPQVSV